MKPLTVLILAFAVTTSATAQEQLTSQQLQEQYGDYVTEAVALLEQLRLVRSGILHDSGQTAAAISSLSAHRTPDRQDERTQLARSWKVVADIIRKTEGTTPDLADTLAVAASLDPENGPLAREAAYEKRRQEKIQRRIDEADRIANAKQNEQAVNP